jgi:hypothetical protein
MKRSSVRKMAGAVTAFALMASAATALAQTKTAQSAMFENTATGTFVIVGNEVWAYNKVTAATYFSNRLVSGPTVTCSGNSTNCNVLNQPATPAVPAPDAQKLNGFIGSNSCNFWDGQALALNPLGPDNQYTQPVTINGLNGKAIGSSCGLTKSDSPMPLGGLTTRRPPGNCRALVASRRMWP